MHAKTATVYHYTLSIIKLTIAIKFDILDACYTLVYCGTRQSPKLSE